MKKLLKRIRAWLHSDIYEKINLSGTAQSIELIKDTMHKNSIDNKQALEDLKEDFALINKMLNLKHITTEIEMIEAIRDYQNIVVYGTGANGHIVISRLRFHHIQAEIQVVSDIENEIETVCNGLIVGDIHNCINSTGIVLITVLDKQKADEMDINSRRLGFKNIIQLSTGIMSDISIRYNTFMTWDRMKAIEPHIEKLEKNHKQASLRNEFLHYQTLNLARLHRMQDKVRRNEKIKVIFTITNVAFCNFIPVCHAMKNKSLFEVVLFLFMEYNVNELQLKEYANSLSDDGFNVIWGYDENNRSILIEDLEPDIIIYQSSYMEIIDGRKTADLQNMGMSNLKNAVLSNLSCFIPYSLKNMAGGFSFGYFYENIEVLPAWLHFVANRYEYALSLKSLTKGQHNVLSGTPIFDAYTDISDFSLPQKLQGKKKVIIYAPHFAFESRKYVTFPIFWKSILELLHEYPEFGFIYKPHPGLGNIFSDERAQWKDTDLNYKGYWEYCKAWENSPNGIIVNDNSYIDWFKHSDCLIMDCNSFIFTWLPTDKPCIYLKNPQLSDEEFYKIYPDHVGSVLKSYYQCNSVENLKNLVNDVIKDGRDIKFEERKRQKDEVIHNLGCAGQYIADYIENKLRE